MRVTPDEALRLGLITKEDAEVMNRTASRTRGKAPDQLPAPLRARIEKALQAQGGSAVEPAPSKKPLASPAVNEESNPQHILYRALCERMPGRPQWEAENLIPGRKFRADIFIPPSVIVEMDGFKFHRSKDAFQNDRLRQNLFTQYGFRPIRAFAAQIFDKDRLEELVDQIERTAQLDSPCGRHMPKRSVTPTPAGK